MGEVFAGRYELLDPVATGGMGTIWRVLDRSDGQVKAAKILRQSDAGSLLRFVREQSMRIDHTHVVTPLSWAGVDDRVLFTMPLVRGGSVADLLRERGPLPVRWVALLTDQVLQALEAVHAAGIVHRDVKPGNLLLEPTGAGRPHLRLTDFGIAAPVDEPRMTRGSHAIGTPGYMPPEQWVGADPDPTADVFAVGRVALEMLIGQRPADEDLKAHRTGEHARDLLLTVVEHATRNDPADRPADASAMRAQLAATGLLTLPPTPGEAVVVPDRFGTAEAVTMGDLPPTTGPTHATAPLARSSTVAFGTGLAPAGRRPSALPGLLLLLAGIVGLAVATWLLVG
ncbi:serine/threonine-protein kinase [Nocardioides sp.]|uniref:serine/threonine-protein kinase n=1 Tax=Nocardioides sp. TaxID=35761 RepID=UPI002722740F|nr:serine/threonine-protein kinase [Nocardioides sp.]MDO9456226.1 serine/threonine-protein kinase [Nocardioides sp.]